MPYLIDGSNVGGALGGASGARDRAAVLRLLLPFARRRRRLVVVFDGPADPTLAKSYGGVTVRFAGARPADQAILAALGSRPADWWVVSDDRELLAACRARGAQVLGAAQLVARLATEAKAGEEDAPVAGDDARTSAVDVADWEEWFRRGGDG